MQIADCFERVTKDADEWEKPLIVRYCLTRYIALSGLPVTNPRCLSAKSSKESPQRWSAATVKLSSFGSFVVRQKKERLGRNPKTGEPACISARRILTFKPSPTLKKRINFVTRAGQA